MLLAWLCKRWNSKSQSALRGNWTEVRRPALQQLHLECLEDRTLFSIFTVANRNDMGDGSFRQAILDANRIPGLDTIAFAIPGAGVHTIAPTFPLPAITD